MKKEYINPFIKASLDVLKTTTNTDYAMRTPYVCKESILTEHVVISIGITGEVIGQTIISMNDQVAKNVASKMMMGMPVYEIDDMAKSALSELGNMVIGNAATMLFNEGITVDITTPTVIIGDNIEITSIKTETIVIPIIHNSDEIRLVISIKVR